MHYKRHQRNRPRLSHLVCEPQCNKTLQTWKRKGYAISFLKEIANRIEGEVSESWNFSPDYEIDIPKISAATVDENDFAAGINAATIKEAVGKAFKKQIAELKEIRKNLLTRSR